MLWPFPPRLRPFLVALHFAFGNKPLALTRGYEAMGARDESSAARFVKAAAGAEQEAFWTACMTLTLQRSAFASAHAPRNATMLVLPTLPTDGKLMRAILPDPRSSDVPQLWLDQSLPQTPERAEFRNPLAAFSAAVSRLEQLALARLVVTSRLHVVLPCIAMGTPVLFVTGITDPRFSGFEPYLEPVRNLADERVRAFDWGSDAHQPTPAHAALRVTARALLHNAIRQVPELVRASYMFNCSA